MTLRIIGGQLRGKKLFSVPGLATRPTSNRVREAMFNILSSEVRAARVLDLFSGTGVLGIEALSRGALHATFVDRYPLPRSVIQKNISACRLDGETTLLNYDLSRDFNWNPTAGGGFQLVFMDPPYDCGFVGPTLSRLHRARLLSNEAIVVVEHSLQEAISDEIAPFEVRDERKYGKTLVSFLLYTISTDT